MQCGNAWVFTDDIDSRLSAYLYQATSNQTYNSSAELSAQFIKLQLYNGTVVHDTINATSCAIKDLGQDTLLSYNTGFFLEGLSVHSISNGPSWLPLCVFKFSVSLDVYMDMLTTTAYRLYSLISTSIPFGGWTSSDGIDTEPGSRHPTSVYLFRGIYSAWNRTVRDLSSPGTNITNYLESYVNVQVSKILTISPHSQRFPAHF